jgi:hypothetical protein
MAVSIEGSFELGLGFSVERYLLGSEERGKELQIEAEVASL